MEIDRKINVLMVGVDSDRIGGMWSVAEAYINNEEYKQYVNLNYIATSTGGTKIKRIHKMFSGYMKIIASLFKNDIDIVHIHMAEKGSVFRKGIVIKIAKWFKVKTVVQIHAGPIMDWYTTLNENNKVRVKRIFNSADKILALGEYWKEQLCEIVPKDKINVLYNGTDCSDNNRYNKDGSYITFLGMITRKKGAYDLIDAINSINTILPNDIKVLLCGFDPEDAAKKYVERRGLNKRILFPGWIDKVTKNKIFNNTCLCVLPSYFEGLSMTVIESIAYGIPIVATNISTMPEILGDKIHMIEAGDVNDLAKDIQYLMENESERLRQSNYLYNRAKTIFSIEENVRRTIGIYKDSIDMK